MLLRFGRPHVGSVANDALHGPFVVVVEERRTSNDKLVREHAEAPDVVVLYEEKSAGYFTFLRINQILPWLLYLNGARSNLRPKYA